MPVGLHTRRRLCLRRAPLPAGATLARSWLWHQARQGRAGAVVGTGPTPSLGINIPGCRRLCLLCLLGLSPAGGGSSPAGPGGGGDQATAQTFPSGQTGPATLLPPPAPFLGGREAMTPHSGFPAAASEAPTWISQPGFPECGRQRRWGARGAGQDTQQREGKGKVRGGQSPPEGDSSRERDGETR